MAADRLQELRESANPWWENAWRPVACTFLLRIRGSAEF
jgi:hypothetical protein